MSGLVERFDQRPGQMLWIDGDAYAWRLFNGVDSAWLQPADFVALQRKAQGLLRSDVVSVSAAAVAAAWISSHPTLAEAMAQKRRATAPLRALLAYTGFRDLLG